MTREQRLQKQFSIYTDILHQTGPQIEIIYAAKKIAEEIYPFMVHDLKSMCLFQLINTENNDINIFHLYLRDYDTFKLTIQESDLIKFEFDASITALKYFNDIDFDIDRPDDHSKLYLDGYGYNNVSTSDRYGKSIVFICC